MSNSESKRESESAAMAMAAMLWTILWLFTSGMCHLVIWRTLIALFIWPYYLGDFFAPTP